MPRNLILYVDCPFGDDCPNKLTVNVMPPYPGSREFNAGGAIEDVNGCREHVDNTDLSEQQDETLWACVAARLEEMSEP